MSEQDKPKQVQCADCWQWIDADKSHACKQQVQRNKKTAKGANR